MSEGAAKKEQKPRKFQAIRGTRDLLPPETALWNRVEQTAHEVFRTFGYGEIRLPIFEDTELFTRAVGGETDIVSKEMYTFEDHDFADLSSLRSTITYRNPDIQNLHSVHSYRDQLNEFVQALGEGLSQGKIPKTSENSRAYDNLRMHAGRVEIVARDWTGGVENAKVRFELLISGVRDALKVVQFGDVLSLRPEVTASVCRAYIENGMQQWPQPVKLYTIGPMFRRERPQKGRYRQFYQIDAEVLGGSDAPAIDAELIEMVMTLFERLGLEGVQLEINCIGDRKCRPKYVELLRAELRKVEDRLGPDSQRRIETNPLRVLDSKLENEQKLIESMPHIADHLCEECAENYRGVKKELELRGVKYRENWRLVRGLDYYSRTTFEITAKGLGSQNAVCGGGRYDGLMELLGGPPTRATGFAIGEDRVVLSLVHDKPLAQRRDIDLVLAWLSPEAHTKSIELARNLRTEGVKVDLPTKLMRAGDAVRYADRIGAYFTLLFGEDELKSGQLTLKHMLRQEQMKITEAELLSYLKQQNELREGRRRK